MEKAKKRTRPPPDDPAQSERFVKQAAELMGQEGSALFERAMKTVVRPAKLPLKPDEAIMKMPGADTQAPVRAKKKRQ